MNFKNFIQLDEGRIAFQIKDNSIIGNVGTVISSTGEIKGEANTSDVEYLKNYLKRIPQKDGYYEGIINNTSKNSKTKMKNMSQLKKVR